MGATTLTHDVVAIGLGLFLVAHAIAGAIVPWSWPLLRSMFTGYVTTDYAKHHHKTWYADLTVAEAQPKEERPAA
jgi:formate dehydrogenase subunit gamma